MTQDTAMRYARVTGSSPVRGAGKKHLRKQCFFQLSLPLLASEFVFGGEVHCVSDVSPFGEVANLTSLRTE